MEQRNLVREVMAPVKTYIVGGAASPTSIRSVKHGDGEVLIVKAKSQCSGIHAISIRQRLSWRRTAVAAETQVMSPTLLRVRLFTHHPSCLTGWTEVTLENLGSYIAFTFSILGTTFAWACKRTATQSYVLDRVMENWQLLRIEDVQDDSNGVEAFTVVGSYDLDDKYHVHRDSAIKFFEAFAPDLELFCMAVVVALVAESCKRVRSLARTDNLANMAALETS